MGYCGNQNTQASICFECENACGNCSWSEIDPATGHTRFEVPRGATAVPVNDPRGKFYTYRIVECPLFIQTPKRKSTAGMLTSSDDEAFLEDPAGFLKRFERR